MTRLGDYCKAVWYVLTLQCEEADRVLAVRRSGAPTTRRERIGAGVHSRLCGSCREARRQLRLLDQAIADWKANGGHEGGGTGDAPAMPDEMQRRLAAAMARAGHRQKD